jgi:Zn-finger nucleic acid-binding protein
MLIVPLADQNSALIDICKACHFVWFDEHEIESLSPRQAAAEPRLSADAYSPASLAGPRWSSVLGQFLNLSM